MSNLNFLDLFSGPYERLDSLADAMIKFGWATAQQIDNDSTHGGGWQHDVMNDSTYARPMELATKGHWHGMMVAISCSIYSPTRFFDASKGDPNASKGPPPVRTKNYPDGLPLEQIPPEFHLKLRT